MKKKRLITAALPYVNNIPHLGNLIQVLSADVFARFCRQRGYETLYICGADEYGTATETKALQEKVSPKELCDRFYKIHKEIYQWFSIDFNHFGRTSTPQQTEIVQAMFSAIQEKGYIAKQEVQQSYCPSCERFLADRYVHGSCPHCHGENARGDQCEDCGKLLEPSELTKPRCGVCGAEPMQKSSEHLFLDLPKIRPELEQWLDEASTKGRWAKNAVQMTKSWIRDGLKQRCITRDLKWGVSVPGMPSKVFYVWFDAPIGYVSITAEHTAEWQQWWQQPENVQLYQFIGKDNIPFHTVLFPAAQLASKQAFAGQTDWTMLHHLSSTEYLNYESGKFSKTRGVGIFGNDCKDTGIPADVWRFYLYYNRPEKSDFEFNWQDFQQLLKQELIGNLGNLVNRTLSFLQRFFDGQILSYSDIASNSEVQSFLAQARQLQLEVEDRLENAQLKEALHIVMSMADLGNKCFQAREPWVLIKQDKTQAQQWLTALVFLLHDLAICLRPFLPYSAARIASFLHLGEAQNLEARDATWADWTKLGHYQELSTGPFSPPEILFHPLEDEVIQKLRSQFAGSQESRIAEAQKLEKSEKLEEQEADPAATFASQVDLRIGKILSVEAHPEAERLFIEQIDCGEEEPRTIVSGLAEHYSPDELCGKNVVVVANLKPAKLRGVKSMGMILAASSEKDESKPKGLVEVIHPSGEPGQRIVIEGFESLAAPEKRISVDKFFAAELFLRDGQVQLRGKGQSHGLFSPSSEAAGRGPALQSSKLKSGQVG